MILMLQPSHTGCILRRRQLLLELCWAQYPMVRLSMCHLTVFMLSTLSVILGIVVVLFFQCMEALLNPVNRAGSGIKWGLVAYTMAMFSFVTVYTAMSLDIQSISYIDNRGFSDDAVGGPGPLGYQTLIFSEAINIVPNTMFLLNNWLADGLLVGSVSNSVARVSDVCDTFSSIAAITFMR
jgi:hypothetical protein